MFSSFSPLSSILQHPYCFLVPTTPCVISPTTPEDISCYNPNAYAFLIPLCLFISTRTGIFLCVLVSFLSLVFFLKKTNLHIPFPRLGRCQLSLHLPIIICCPAGRSRYVVLSISLSSVYTVLYFVLVLATQPSEEFRLITLSPENGLLWLVYKLPRY